MAPTIQQTRATPSTNGCRPPARRSSKGAEEATAGNIIFKTVWDGGGNDTYDLSAYATHVSIDLNPGCWTTTSTSQLANLSGNSAVLAPGNVANSYLCNNKTQSLIENAIGGSGDDTIVGNVAANTLTGEPATTPSLAAPATIG